MIMKSFFGFDNVEKFYPQAGKGKPLHHMSFWINPAILGIKAIL